MTLKQLRATAPQRNLLLMMTASSGSAQVDSQLHEETMLELVRGWAIGPSQKEDLKPGATIARRFPLEQGSKVRMIDDFSISGVNDSCEIHNKLDLHMIDTFCAVIKQFFLECGSGQRSSSLILKTYDSKSAYRQVPIDPAHYRYGYAYFSMYNCVHKATEIYRLRFSRTLFVIATISPALVRLC